MESRYCANNSDCEKDWIGTEFEVEWIYVILLYWRIDYENDLR